MNVSDLGKTTMENFQVKNKYVTKAAQNSVQVKKNRKLIISITALVLILVALIACLIGLLVYFLVIKKANSQTNTYIIPLQPVLYNNLNFSTNNSCGLSKTKPDLNNVRIINGYQAVPHSWPWMASIGFYGPKSSYTHVCGGSLINRKYILTAGHCVDETTLFGMVGYPIKGSGVYENLAAMGRVYLGIYDRSKDINSNNTYQMKRIISNPNFDDYNVINDVALIELDRMVIMTDEIQTVCLNSMLDLTTDQSVYTIGWGTTSATILNYPSYLYQVKLNVLDTKTCSEFDYDIRQQICAGTPKGSILPKDSCNGDSGGPLMIPLVGDRWLQVGLVSYGVSDCSGFGVYTSVKYYYDWITANSAY